MIHTPPFLSRRHRLRGMGGSSSEEAPVTAPGSGNEANWRFWIDATRLAAVYNDSDPMDTWPDLLGVQDFIQGLASRKPLYKTGIKNGNAAVLFDGIDDSMNYGSVSTLLNDVDGDFTLAGAFKFNSVVPAASVVFHKGDGLSAAGTTMEIANWNGAPNATYGAYAVGASYNVLHPGANTEDTLWHTYIWRRSGSTFELYLDGSTLTASSTLAGTMNDCSRIPRIGSACTNTYYSNIYIGELYLITEAITSGQIITEAARLGGKWL